jgi:hypothetical protein
VRGEIMWPQIRFGFDDHADSVDAVDAVDEVSAEEIARDDLRIAAIE